MHGVGPETFDPVLLKRVIFTIIGLSSCFMGLWIYKSSIKMMGFLVGVTTAGYIVFILMTENKIVMDMSNIGFVLLVIGLILAGGFVGMFLMKAFQYVIFFFAGGILALIIARLWTGEISIQDFQSFEGFRIAVTNSSADKWEIVIFCAGGLLYMLNIGPVVALTTAVFGAFILRWAWQDVLLKFGPDIPNISALLLVVTGTTIQLMAFRNRMAMLPPKFRGLR